MAATPARRRSPPLLHQTVVFLVLVLVLVLQLRASAAAPTISTKAVARLPGFSGPLPFSLETGYVGLDDGARLFYYFIQSERSPEEDPILLWLTGGPGCSALSGLAYEIGPLSFDFEGYTGGLPTLLYKAESWTKVSNVILVDSPAGTGFSYAATSNKIIPSDTTVVHQLHIFLKTWFDEHPQFLSNSFYISGDSYSGIIIPYLALEIANGIESSDERRLNLKGLIAGNPLTDRQIDNLNAKFQFLHGMGIIPDEFYQVARKSCRGQYKNPSNTQCANSIKAISNCINDLNDDHILEQKCPEYPTLTIHKPSTLQDGRKRLLESAVSPLCRNATYFLSELWTNDEDVRESLGIHKGTVPSWLRCDFDLPYTMDIDSAVDAHLTLITKGYRTMVYSGDHDSKTSFVGTQAWLRYLNLSITDDWRPWYVDGQVTGFTRTYSNNLTYATVKGAGHTATEYMPRECLAMVDRWLSTEPL